MNYRENLRYFVLFGTIFFIVYLAAAIKPLDKEFFIQTERSVYLGGEEQNLETAAGAETPENANLFPFRLGEYAGYFSESGEIVFAQKIPFKATLTKSFCSFYDNNSDKIEIRKTDNSGLITINRPGFPFLQENRIYLLPPGGNSISEYSTTGTKKWTYESYTPITAFNSSKNGSVIGFADGALVCLSPEGNENFAFYPGGSTYETILGAAISETENMTACISGLKKQRFILSTYDKTKHKVIFHEYLDKDLRERAVVQFSKDSSHVFFQYKDGLGIVDCKKLKSTHIPLRGSIVQIEELEKQNLILVLSKDKDEYHIYIIEDSNKLLGSFSIKAKCAFITQNENSFFVGHDTTISKLSIERK